MKLAAILASVALAAGALPGLALADPAAAPPAPDAAAAERLQLAHQLFELSGGQKAVDQRIELMFATSSRLAAGSLPPDGAKFAVAMQADMHDEMLKLIPSIMDISIEAYADNLTTQELRDYVAWLSSPSGQSIIAKSPAIQREALERSTPMMAMMLPRLQQRVSDRVCEQVHCTPAERKVVAAAMAKAFGGKS